MSVNCVTEEVHFSTAEIGYKIRGGTGRVPER